MSSSWCFLFLAQERSENLRRVASLSKGYHDTKGGGRLLNSPPYHARSARYSRSRNDKHMASTRSAQKTKPIYFFVNGGEKSIRLTVI